jgi:hypothetical protein
MKEPSIIVSLSGVEDLIVIRMKFQYNFYPQLNFSS